LTVAWLTDTVTADLDRAMHYTLLWGLEAVVLRTVGGPGDRVPHVNEARLRRRLEEAELPLAAIDPGLFEAPAESRSVWLNDLAAFDDTAAFCRRTGCRLVIVGALAGPAGEPWDPGVAGEVLARAADRGAAAGVRLAVRNATNTGCATGEDLAAVLTAARALCSSDGARGAIGAAWSPADAARAGEGAMAGLDALRRAGAPIFYVSVRDGREGAEDWTDTPPGDGDVGWSGQIDALVADDFDGTLGLEVHGRPTGTFGLRAAAALIGLVRSSARPAPSSP
jgi:sugar phosphate isomerase/epimerase